MISAHHSRLVVLGTCICTSSTCTCTCGEVLIAVLVQLTTGETCSSSHLLVQLVLAYRKRRYCKTNNFIWSLVYKVDLIINCDQWISALFVLASCDWSTCTCTCCLSTWYKSASQYHNRSLHRACESKVPCKIRKQPFFVWALKFSS